MPFPILHIKIIMLQCKDLTKNGKERLYSMTNEQSIVKVERLTKRIGSKTLVENISFEVKKGEVVGLLGPNGAGKTTLMRMMVGMIRMTEGEVWIDGQSVKQQFESTASKIGAVIEAPEFYPFLSGYENLTYFGRMNGNVTEERIDEVVKLLGMGQVIDRKVKAYSLGMRQRLGIAQALIHDPDVLILDEPTNGLDPSGIHEMRMYIKKIAHEQGKAVLVSSHLLSEVELMCDRVIIIQHGEYVATQNIQHNQSEEMETIRIRVDDANKAAEMLDQDVLIKGNDLLITVKDEEIPNVIRTLLEKNIQVYRVYEERKTLEEQFLELTGGKDIV
ncbi:ABC transporter ATP-binding protein [Bacillus wiedmannii]|uniref:ABC transporter ATP-binding protein n=2 Tax=Bacillaceae TaxID=186817 RepID=A0A2A8BHE0_9BACI|nr:ABC transporter ATP-binding protein [Bacillus wiedmannii]PGA98557.1 ABC transporter ATP-binding protein [Bacillus wiedmannii]